MHIGLGTAALGRPQYINIKQEKGSALSLDDFKERSLKTLDYAYAKGVRYFDTAPGYGMAERLITEWLDQQNDSSIVIATKWGYTYVANFDPKAKVHEIKEHSFFKLNEQWKISKKLLPFLKYYQIHSATIETGVLEDKKVLERLFELKNEYHLKVGLTTTGSNQAEVLQKGIDVHFRGEQLFEVFQCTFNPLDQSIYNLGHQILKANKKLVIKEAMANGRLFPNKKFSNHASLHKELQRIAIKYRVGADAVLLNYSMSKFKQAIILSGASTPDHLLQNLKATDFQLTQEEINHLSQFKMSPSDYWFERNKLTWN
ncbi:aldo/keto reductase [Ascidiimonas sp. W6]|uniref:aldo/keto reductase n=1 Tax=Ascidiimonas meishanensis TaxID=3128903 RepID=UPI0030EF507B